VEARANGRAAGLGIASPIAMALIGLGLGATGLWVVGAQLLARSPGPPVVLMALVALLPLACLQDLARSLRLAGMSERSMFVGDVLITAVRLLALGLAVGLVHMRGLWVGVAALALGGLASLLTIRRFLQGIRCAERLRRLWGLGRWLVVDVFLSGLMIYGVWLLFVPKAGSEVAGQMRASQQLFAPVQTVTLGLNLVLIGRFAASRRQSRRDVRWSGFLQLALVGAWGLLVTGLGPTVAGVVFGDAFQVPRGDLAALTAAVMATTAFELAAVRLRAERDTRRLLAARLTVTLVGMSGVVLLATSVVRLALVILVSHLVGLSATRAGRTRTGLRQVSRCQ
jgi:hypothetical protein